MQIVQQARYVCECGGEWMCVRECVCVYVSKNDQASAKLEPWTAVSAYFGLISKAQSSAGAGGQLHTYNKVNSSSLVGQVYQ